MGNSLLQCLLLAKGCYHRIWPLSTKSYIIWYAAENKIQDVVRSKELALRDETEKRGKGEMVNGIEGVAS